MNIVPPVSLPQIVVHPASQPTHLSGEERRHDLLMHQMIRATVQEGGQEKALLQFGDRTLWVQSKIALRAGEQLNLQVVETHPELKLRILDSGLLERLGRSLYLLGDKPEVAAVTRDLAARATGASDARASSLQGLLNSLTRAPDTPLAAGEAAQTLAADLALLSRRLGLGYERQILSGQPEQAAMSLKNAVLENLGRLTEGARLSEQGLRPLMQALEQLPRLAADSPDAAARWAALPESVKPVLEPLLVLARVSPAGLGREQAAALVAALSDALRAWTVEGGSADNSIEARLRSLAAAFAESVASPQMARDALPVSLDGRQRDFLATLLRLVRGTPRQLAGGEGEDIARRLQSLVTREATSSGAQALEQTQDTLRHLELWQMCRARLAEIGVDFLPLPMDFLERGFLLARRHQGSDEGGENGAESGQSHSLSLFLELEGLGRLQIDCLYQNKGLYLRFSCRNQDVAAFLGAAQDELRQGLGETELLGASFAAGAEEPAQALIQRLIPAETQLLDARA